MAKGKIVFIDGSTVGLNTTGKKVGGDGPDKDKLAVEETVTGLKGVPFTINGVDGKRVADLHNGDEVRISEVGEGDQKKAVRGVATSAKDPAKPVVGELTGLPTSAPVTKNEKLKKD